MSKVSQVTEGDTKGFWLTSQGFTLGLVAEKDKPPYVCIYAPKEVAPTKNGLPTVALTLNPTTGQPQLQLADEHGFKVYSLGDIMERIGIPFATQAEPLVAELTEIPASTPIEVEVEVEGGTCSKGGCCSKQE